MSLILPLMRIPKGVVGGKVGNYIAFNRFYLDGSSYGGLIGPIKDAARLIQIHINGGYANGIRIISGESVTKMQQISSRGETLDVGFGWFRRSSSLERFPYLQQIGGGAGFFNIMRVYPQEQIGVVVMGNSTSFDIERVIETARATNTRS